MSDLGKICQQVQEVAGEMKGWAASLEALSNRIRRCAGQAQALMRHGSREPGAARALDAAARSCRRAAASLLAAKASAEQFVAFHGAAGGRSATSGDQESSTRAEFTTDQVEFISAEFRTSAGSAFFYPDDHVFRSAAHDVPEYPGEYVLDLHGTPTSVQLIDSEGEVRELDAKQFAEVVRQTEWVKTAIRLFACDTGRRSDGFAQELANALDVPVTAPTTPVWSDPHGRPVVSDGEFDPASGRWRPKKPPTGTWNTFNPESTDL